MNNSKGRRFSQDKRTWSNHGELNINGVSEKRVSPLISLNLSHKNLFKKIGPPEREGGDAVNTHPVVWTSSGNKIGRMVRASFSME